MNMAQKKQKTPEKDEKYVQPELNLGLVGHVDHGKTTLVKALSGKWTDTHSEEIRRGITIRLGYADFSVYQCSSCKGPERFSTKNVCEKCGKPAKLLRKISLVDAPGHESLMATMISGAAIMDGALLLVAANENCPQPQTREHLMALEIVGVEKIVIIQNKIDLVSEEQAKRNYEEIRRFIQTTRYKDAPIIPISAQHSVNIHFLLQAIQEHIPTPKRDPSKPPLFFVARSFDINKPGTHVEKLQGGVLGGVLKQGVLKKGQEIEIRPGRMVEEQNQKTYKPIITRIASLAAGGNIVDEVGPGGSVGVSTMLDPSIVKSDQLAGSLVGLPGQLPPVRNELSLEVHLLERVVGTQEDLKVENIKLGEVLMHNVNSSATVGVVDKLGKNTVHVRLKLPVCAEEGSRVTISRRIGDRFRLIGYGFLKE